MIRGLAANTVGPGIDGSNRFFVTGLNTSTGDGFVMKITWKASLDQSVKNAIVPLLAGVIDDESIDLLTKQTFTFSHYGT